MDDDIRDLAKNHGHVDLSDDMVAEVKQELSAAYIDDILDTGQEIDVGQSQVTETPIGDTDEGTA